MLDFKKIMQSPGFHIGYVSQALRNNITKRFNENGYDITFAQWPMLVTLWHFENLSQNAVSKMMQRDKTSVARMLSGMENNMLISRETDPNDRRNKLINLTDKGKELVSQLVPIMHQFVDDMCLGMSQDEVNTLNSLLDKIFTNIEGASLHDAGTLSMEKLFLIKLNESK